MKALVSRVVIEEKIAGVNEEAHLGHRNILASTLARQAHYRFHLGQPEKLPMTLQVDIKARVLGNLTQGVQVVCYENQDQSKTHLQLVNL